MNANEVIANRGLELLGHRRGDYARLHPLDHVNLGQSTNDVYPTALKVGLHFAVHRLQLAMTELVSAFAEKAVEFGGHLKMGRRLLDGHGQCEADIATANDQDIQHRPLHIL